MSRYEGLVNGLDESVYHSLPGLSSTGAKKILKSPAHFQHYINAPRVEKDEFDLGSAVHTKVLGVGADIAIYPDGPGESEYEWWEHEGTVLNIRGGLGTKLSAEFEEKARENGLIPVKRVTARVVDKMAESLLGNREARAFLDSGTPEVSMFANVEGVDCRGRVDSLGRVMGDVKTTGKEASESDFARQVFTLGYHVQYGHYEDIYEAITGETLPWVFMVVESNAPYLSGVFVLGEDEQKMGRAEARLARERYLRARETNHWGGYTTRSGEPIGMIRAPQYAIYDYIDAHEGAAA